MTRDELRQMPGIVCRADCEKCWAEEIEND